MQFISTIRFNLHGSPGLVRDPVQTETLDQLRRQLIRLIADQKVDHLKARVEDLSRSVATKSV